MSLIKQREKSSLLPSLPRVAAWQHRTARNGFEVVFLSANAHGQTAKGSATAVEGDAAWAVRYDINVDPNWLTQTARVTCTSTSGDHKRTLRSDGGGQWRVDGIHSPHLSGCLDIDLEASALTNAFPVHRLGLRVGEHADAPAAYVRAADLDVERLEQSYTRLDDVGARQRYRYTAPAFSFECELLYDEAGLLLDYPGIATRVA